MLIFTKMETAVLMNPGEVMGEFVNKYETLIIPGIKNRNMRAVRGVIGDCCIRSGSIQGEMSDRQFAGYMAYGQALGHLRVLLEEQLDRMSPEALEKAVRGTLLRVDRQIAELDFIMKDDGDYNRHRQGGEK